MASPAATFGFKLLLPPEAAMRKQTEVCRRQTIKVVSELEAVTAENAEFGHIWRRVYKYMHIYLLSVSTL